MDLSWPVAIFILLFVSKHVLGVALNIRVYMNLHENGVFVAPGSSDAYAALIYYIRSAIRAKSSICTAAAAVYIIRGDRLCNMCMYRPRQKRAK